MSIPSNSDQPGSRGAEQHLQLDQSLRLQIWETPLLRPGSSVLEAFAWEEVMCRRVGEGQLPVAHIWRHPDAFVAGLRDRRLPQAVEAMERMRSQGTAVCVRPSGGAAVPLNPGVVNVSLILPNPGRAINIHDDFREMASLIAESLTPWSSQARTGEIEGAFCPGDYDVSVGGLKFCGIAQRRQAKAYIITAFIIVEGQGDQLAADVRQFYQDAADGASEGYPDVRPGTMASLQELAGVPSSAAYTASLVRTLRQRFPLAETSRVLSVDRETVRRTAEQMKLRYD
ncbi:lipoate--protein ligase family protein [Paenibacillus sp. UMB7766-LJ446]|uniref:lipoate--protein ligase family protein n=1 Tax=Paenibacillus sp. UMB7766-LJ446 TaxID=3046313 RepID=UPI00254DD0EE|nr:lipoate--protein ligase family protein [Paenibacillus sp. UMB7766-LJ446]MDK8194269.1 lipoate--protein ligase family protein [Paenibacillus sp. UMB7766-LJ446]